MATTTPIRVAVTRLSLDADGTTFILPLVEMLDVPGAFTEPPDFIAG